MQKKVRKAAAGLLAGVLCLSSVASGFTVYAEENEFITATNSAGVTITGITDAAIHDGKVTIPDELNGSKVTAIGTSDATRSFLNGKQVETLSIGKNVRSFGLYSLYDTPGLTKIEVPESGSPFTTDEASAAIFASSKGTKILLKLCPEAVSSYVVPDDVAQIWNMDHMDLDSLNLKNVTTVRKLALAGTDIGTLSIGDAKSSDGTTNILYGATVDSFNTDNSTIYETDGKALWSGSKLIKVAAGAEFSNDYFSRFTDVSPYAFNSIPEYQKVAESLPDSAVNNKVFSFYSQNDAVFMVNGEIGFCYNHDKSVPDSVGTSESYSASIDSGKYNKIRALMYVGVPVDGTGLFESTFGVSYKEALANADVMEHGDAALNVVSALVYRIVDNAEPDTIRGTGYGPFTEANVAAYRAALLEAVENYSDYNFEPVFSVEDNTVSFHRSGNGYESDPFVIHTSNASGTEMDSYIYTLNITTDSISVKGGGNSFCTGESVTLASDTMPTSLSFSYNEPSLKYYKKTSDSVQDVLASAVSSKTADLNVNVTTYDLSISKQDITTKKELPGATLTLTKDGQIIDTWESTTTPHKLTNPADGTYTLTEEKAPANYSTAESITFTIKDGKLEDGGTQIVMYDELKTDTIFTISKQDITTKKELPGATLTLTKDGQTVDTWESTTTPHKIMNPADGTYTLTEEKAPANYSTAESITFTIKDGKLEDGGTQIVMYDELKTDTIFTISKQDITTKKELPGATLTLTKDGQTVDTWESTTAPHKLTNPEDGTYTLTEEQAPANYSTAESITFTIKDGKLKDGGTQIVMYDELKVDTIFTISKQDITTKKELSGATLTLTKDGQTVDTWESTTTPHKITNPADGTYTLTEEKAPANYSTAESITFTIKDGKLENGGIQIVMYDELKPDEPDQPTVSSVEISKTSATTGKELPGAKLILSDENGKTVEEWTSGNTPHIITDLKDGIYTLTEIRAPKGYEIAESIEFEIKDGKTTQTIVMVDEESEPEKPDTPATPSNPDKPATPSNPDKPTKPSHKSHSSSGGSKKVTADWYLEISKQDITTKAELPGASLTITKDGAVIDSWTSTNEPHKIKNLADGDYVLTEVTAPNGYDVAESITFTVEGLTLKDGSGKVVMYDSPTKAPEPTPEPTPTPTPSSTPLPKTGVTDAAAVFTLASGLCAAIINRKKNEEDQ